MARVPRRPTDTELASSVSTTSVTDLLSGLSSFMLNYFKLKFPAGTFKETYIEGSLNSNALSKSIGDIQKLPYLGMEIEFSDEESIIGPTPRTMLSHRVLAKTNREYYYRKIFEDRENQIKIYAIPRPLRTTFNFYLKFQTHLQALDWSRYINDNFDMDGVNYINGVRLPIEIPNYFLERIAERYEIYHDDEFEQEAFRDYLRNNSLGGISYTLNTSTGNKDYMYTYVTNLLLQYPERATSDKDEIGFTVRNGIVEFSVDVEINAPTGFLLEIRDGSLLPAAPPNDPDNFTLDFYIITEDVPKELSNGKMLLEKTNFKTEVNKTVDDLDVSAILTPDLKQTIEAIANVADFDIEILFEYRVYAGRQLLSEEFYDIDYGSHRIDMSKTDPNTNYILALYGDIERLNAINNLIMEGKRHKIKPLLYDYMDSFYR